MAKKIITMLLISILATGLLVSAAPAVYTVVRGDSMWKIAVKYEIGLSEIISANPQIKNPALIYPGQKMTIPEASPLLSLEKEVFTLINRERTSRGLSALSYDWQIARTARYKATDMVQKNYFSHTSPTYGSPFTMLKNFGVSFSAAAENIAYGQPTAASVVKAWMNSSGHRANILSPSYTLTGVGAAKTSNGTLYWAQMFTRP